MASGERKRRIVILLGLTRDDAALEWVLGEVNPSTDELHLVRPFRVLDLPECYWEPVTRRNDESRLAARTLVSGAVNRVRLRGAPVEVSGSAVAGTPDDVLVGLAEVSDLVVLNSANLDVGGLRRLARQLPCPLVVLPSEAAAPPGGDRPVALELDRPLLPAATTGFAFDEARRRRTGLVVTLSWALGVPGDPSDRAEQRAWQTEQQTGLDAALAGWRNRYPEVPVTVALRQESPYTSLRHLGGAAQLVVVPRWGGGALPLPTLALIRQRCPVAIVPEPVPLTRASRDPAVALAG